MQMASTSGIDAQATFSKGATGRSAQRTTGSSLRLLDTSPVTRSRRESASAPRTGLGTATRWSWTELHPPWLSERRLLEVLGKRRAAALERYAELGLMAP